MDSRKPNVACFIDFPPKLGGDKGKSLVRLMHEIRFLPTIGGLTKKQAIYITRVFSKGRPPPSKYFDLCFCFSENGFCFARTIVGILTCISWNQCSVQFHQ